jgi:RTX calcium-binding nonapeptide repeat (4 copies)
LLAILRRTLVGAIASLALLAAPAGAVPIADSDVDALDFGTIAVGSIGPSEAVTVFNAGDGILEITDVSRTGTHTADFLLADDTCEGALLAMDASCVIALRYAPSDEGAGTAELEVASNDSASPLVVGLTGAGQGPAGPAGTCDGQPATVAGATSGDDHLVGTEDVDVIAGLGGDDVLRGLGGDDVICGGSGDDVLAGGSGSDSLRGAAGRDALRGRSGGDLLSGGANQDLCNGGSGSNEYRGCERRR